MVVLRCTQQLLRRLRASPQAEVPRSTTKLGDWYGTAFQVGRRRYGLFISEHTRLPILLDAAELRHLPDALSERMGQVLTVLGVYKRAIDAERAAMAEVAFAPTRSRSLLGSLNDFGFMARAGLISRRPESLLEMSLDLAEVPVGPLKFQNPGDAARELLGRQAPSTDPAARVELAVVADRGRTALCRRLDGGGWTSIRAPRFWDLAPGEFVVVNPTSEWTDAGSRCLAGEIESERLDVRALGLTPLRLERCGEWDPMEQYWGEDGDPIEEWAKPIIARGPRPLFEMEQVLPGMDLDDPDGDPICRSNDLKDAGDTVSAREVLMDLCEADLRCLDAHAHLGNLAFDLSAELAIRHYEVGVRVGELSLGDKFDGVLSWGLIDNRPFLRCLYGYGLCLWRLERFDEAAGVFERILWLNPSDNQGARFVIDLVRARRRWKREER
jgi:tetratricopeptide (TPR) repeat protein